MPVDPRKRQKKLAKRKAQRKQKAKTLQIKQQERIEYEAHRIASAARYPIHQCFASAGIFAGGMGTVVLSRLAPNGDIVAGIFLLDTFCLGVKNSFARSYHPYDYDEMISSIRQNELLQAVEPSYARKLVEESEAYARKLGFAPDADYKIAKDIFGDIDAGECADEFTFGKNGKPYYVAGPRDSPMRRQQILATLEKNCGAGNYDFMTAISNDSLYGISQPFDDDFDEFDDEFDLDDEGPEN